MTFKPTEDHHFYSPYTELNPHAHKMFNKYSLDQLGQDGEEKSEGEVGFTSHSGWRCEDCVDLVDSWQLLTELLLTESIPV